MNRKLSTTATLVAMVLLIVGMLGVGSASAQYPPPAPPGQGETFVVSTPGATITVRGNNWGNARVTVVRKNGSRSAQQSAVAGQAVFRTEVGADEDGQLEAFALPSDLEPGEYELVVEGTDASGDTRVETQGLEVQAAPAGDEDEAGALATSGITNLHLLSVLGLGALAVGAIALRRRSDA